jgi:hypothetical protein
VNGVKLTGRRALVVAGAAVIVAAGAATALAVGLPTPRTSQVTSLPADGHSTATLKVISGTRLLSLRVANLGGTSGTLLSAIGGGSVFSTPGWAAGQAGFDIDATAGAARVSVIRYGVAR